MQDYYVDTINFGLAKGPKLKELINQELLIKSWRNEVETEQCALINYDKHEIHICWLWGNDDRYINAVKKRWKDWHVTRQNKGLIFHFSYTQRDFLEYRFAKTGCSVRYL